MGSAWQQSPWPFEYPPGYSRGLVTPQRKWLTSNFLGGARERMAVSSGGQNLTPYWYALNYPLAARQSLDDQIVPLEGTAIVAMVATRTVSVEANVPASRTRILQVVDETNQLEMERSGVNDLNRFGSAQQPFYCMRPPMYPPDFGSILVRCGNLLNQAVTVQLCFVGLIVRPKTQ